MLLSIGVGLAQGAFLLHWFERYNEAVENAIAFENKRGEIARLDEVLTMSARLHAATGKLIWHDRYLTHVEPLHRMLEEALTLAANDEAQKAIDQVAYSNTALIAFEERAMSVTAEGRSPEALAILTSPDYERQKVSYQEGLTEALEISRGSLQDKIDGNRDWLIVAAFVLVTSLLVLSELWRRLSVGEQRQAAERIKASLEREQHLSSQQRQFVSMLSHEFRTPLAIIDGRARQLLRQVDSLTDDKIRLVGEKVCGAVRHLTGLMEGVLNVSRIEEGGIDIHPEAFDPAVMIEDVVAGYREVNGDRRIDLTLDDLPATMRGDPRLLNQVVSNLVSNALKYSESGRAVRVEGYRKDRDVVIAVHDEGVGIPKDEIDKLGQRFFRASSSTGIAGTGIGLHFIGHLIDLHGGRMEIKSTEGAGSSFLVHLPDRSATPPVSELHPSKAAAPVLSPA